MNGHTSGDNEVGSTISSSSTRYSSGRESANETGEVGGEEDGSGEENLDSSKSSLLIPTDEVETSVQGTLLVDSLRGRFQVNGPNVTAGVEQVLVGLDAKMCVRVRGMIGLLFQRPRSADTSK